MARLDSGGVVGLAAMLTGGVRFVAGADLRRFKIVRSKVVGIRVIRMEVIRTSIIELELNGIQVVTVSVGMRVR